VSEKFKRDKANFEKLLPAGTRFTKAMDARSCFQTVAVQQIEACFEVTGGACTAEIIDLSTEQATAFIGTQLVEDGIRAQRHAEKAGENRRVSDHRVFGALIQDQVLEVRHHFDAIDYQNVSVPSGCSLSKKRFRPTFKQQSINIKSIISASPSPSWYSPGASNQPQRYADLEITELAVLRGDVCSAEDAWLTCLVDSPSMLVRRKTETNDATWMLSTRVSFDGHSAFGWPTKIVDIPDAGVFLFPRTDVKELHWIVVFDVNEWEAAPYKDLSPVALQLMHPNVDPHLFTQPLWQNGDPEDLMTFAAHRAFWKIPKPTLQKLATHAKMDFDRSWTFFKLLYEIVKFILKCSDEAALKICAMRAKSGNVSWEELLKVDAAADLLEKSDQDELKKTKKSYEKEKVEKEDFRLELVKEKVRVGRAKAKALAKASAKAKAAAAKAKPKLNNHLLPVGILSQFDVQKFAPPGSHTWRSRHGSWQVHLPPAPRRSRSWLKYGEREAAVLILQYAWEVYLEAHDMAVDACPIKGLFGDGYASTM
jgi:hypothetical protein